MPKTGFVVAIVIAVVAAFGLSTGAGAQEPPPQGNTDNPFFSCRSSVARLVLGGGSPIEPITANPNEKECADDAGGAPTIALPPPPSAAVVTAKTVQATTDILCSLDDPDPDKTLDNNDLCDAGEPTFEEQVVSRARVEDARVVAGSFDIRAQVANTRARAYCAGTVPVLESTSTVVNVTINGQTIEIPPGPDPTTVPLGAAGKVVFNERIGTEGPSGASSGELTRRAIHVQVPDNGSVVDAIVAESKADFHGAVCVKTVGAPPQCPPGSTPNELGQCVVVNTQCPPGSTFNEQGQCVIANVRCPDGTFFDPQTISCLESPQGGQLIPLGQLKGFVGSPCRAARFGRDFAIIGTNGSDKITGTNRSDRIFSLGGADRVSGGRGDDCVEGGGGRDVLDGSNGKDYLIGGSGRDVLTGGPSKDQLVGGSGRDVLSGGTGNDVMRGGGGADRLQGGFGSDRLIGGAGNDGINTGAGRDVVNAGPGNDVINAGTRGPAARIDCGPGKDRVRINNNERKRIKNCEFVDVFERIRSQGRPVRR